MTDIEARANRVRAVAESVGGKVLDRNGDAMRIEIPADVAPGLMMLWGEGGFIPIFRHQEFRSGTVSMAYYVYDVGLQPPTLPTVAAGTAAITAPTPPFKGTGP